MPARTPRRWTPLYAASIFLGAALSFALQPMIARALLPWFGGSPAVWGICLVFFQTALLAGYAWAALGPRLLGHRRHGILQGIGVALPLLLLPLAPDPRWIPAPGAAPALWLLAALATSAGPASVSLSTHSTTVQRWFSRSEGSADPYFLYAASNAGSLLALAAWPLVVEPALGVTEQARWWSVGYGLFVASTWALLGRSWRAPAEEAPAGEGAIDPDRSGAGGPSRWAGLSALGSALLVSISVAVTTDVAPLPLLWVVPLALYLAAFSIAFAAPIPRRPLAAITAAGVALALGLRILGVTSLLWAELGVLLGLLFAGCLLLDRDLAASRPGPSALGAFYLWIALGGALGGAGAQLLAPLVFDSVAELPLTLAALTLTLRDPEGRAEIPSRLRRPGTWAVALGMAGMAILAWRGPALDPTAPAPLWSALACGPALWGALLWGWPGLFELGALIGAAALLLGVGERGALIAAERSFYGVSRVVEIEGERLLMHGSTTHGGARIDAPTRPMTYYHRDAPMGRAVLAAGARVGIVGLGAGGLAALTRPGQRMAYYELDPTVERMARAHFGFLDAAEGEVSIVPGDARLTLATAAPGGLDLLILDAFSSDAVPIHLLTREAIALYLGALAPDGLLLAHISNRHLDLAPVFLGHARALGLEAGVTLYLPGPDAAGEGALPNRVVALSRAPLSGQIPGVAWSPLAGAPVDWTDDRAAIGSILSGAPLGDR